MCFSGKSWITVNAFEDNYKWVKIYSLGIKFASNAITKLVSGVVARMKVFEFAVTDGLVFFVLFFCLADLGNRVNSKGILFWPFSTCSCSQKYVVQKSTH